MTPLHVSTTAGQWFHPPFNRNWRCFPQAWDSTPKPKRANRSMSPTVNRSPAFGFPPCRLACPARRASTVADNFESNPKRRHYHRAGRPRLLQPIDCAKLGPAKSMPLRSLATRNGHDRLSLPDRNRSASINGSPLGWPSIEESCLSPASSFHRPANHPEPRRSVPTSSSVQDPSMRRRKRTVDGDGAFDSAAMREPACFRGLDFVPSETLPASGTTVSVERLRLPSNQLALPLLEPVIATPFTATMRSPDSNGGFA